jgi:hypothetical protein
VAWQVKFETKIYHMNVNDKGEICVPELKDNWSPALTMVQSKLLPKISTPGLLAHFSRLAVIGLITKLMKEPETENPLNSEIAQLYKGDKKKHDETAARFAATRVADRRSSCPLVWCLQLGREVRSMSDAGRSVLSGSVRCANTLISTRFQCCLFAMLISLHSAGACCTQVPQSCHNFAACSRNLARRTAATV